MSNLTRATFCVEFFVLLVVIPSTTCTGVNMTDLGSSELGSGMDKLLPQTSLIRCIPLSEAVRSNFIFSVCLSYFPDDKHFILDYREEYGSLTRTLGVLNNALVSAAGSTPFCNELLRAYTCNYVYPGCSNETGLPQGICTEECQRYVLSNVCRWQFNSLVQSTRNIGSAFTRQCHNTLFLLQEYGIDGDDFDPFDCINITDQINDGMDITTSTESDNNNSINSTSETKPTPLTVTVAIVDTAAGFDRSILIGTLLPSISVVLLVVIAVSTIVLTLWKARMKKKAMNFQDSLTVYNRYQPGWTEGDCHDYDEVALDLFHLSEDDVHAFVTNDKLRKVLVPIEYLYITGELGEGAFGRVFKGLLQIENTMNDGQRRILPVAIKTVKNTQGMYRELKAFIEESALMCSFNHPHVLGMVGICLDTAQSPYLLLPYMTNGDLRTFLRNKRGSSKDSDDGYPEGLDYTLLVRMCYEIATGMEYLASKKLVHRDLAARNCVVDQDLSVKVADFGLARVMYQTDYYRQHQQMKVPVKWMAPESLHDMISSEKSDVWSYGVVCWEVFSLGRLPYPTLANHEVVDYLEEENRLKKPALCSDIIYELMLKCWEGKAEKRPTFTEIVSQYHDGLIAGTSKADEGDGYVLLGIEENSSTALQHQELREEKSNDTSVIDITVIDNNHQNTPSIAGTTFHVTLLHDPKGTEQPTEAQSEKEYYMEMNAAPNVFVNQAAHEYDIISDEASHVTSSADHVIPDAVNNVSDVEHELEYIVMKEAEPAKPTNQKQDSI